MKFHYVALYPSTRASTGKVDATDFEDAWPRCLTVLAGFAPAGTVWVELWDHAGRECQTIRFEHLDRSISQEIGEP